MDFLNLNNQTDDQCFGKIWWFYQNFEIHPYEYFSSTKAFFITVDELNICAANLTFILFWCHLTLAWLNLLPNFNVKSDLTQNKFSI